MISSSAAATRATLSKSTLPNMMMIASPGGPMEVMA